MRTAPLLTSLLLTSPSYLYCLTVGQTVATPVRHVQRVTPPGHHCAHKVNILENKILAFKMFLPKSRKTSTSHKS